MQRNKTQVYLASIALAAVAVVAALLLLLRFGGHAWLGRAAQVQGVAVCLAAVVLGGVLLGQTSRWLEGRIWGSRIAVARPSGVFFCAVVIAIALLGRHTAFLVVNDRVWQLGLASQHPQYQEAYRQIRAVTETYVLAGQGACLVCAVLLRRVVQTVRLHRERQTEQTL